MDSRHLSNNMAANYYEHILRNKIELDIRRQCINNNPINWFDDE